MADAFEALRDVGLTRSGFVIIPGFAPFRIRCLLSLHEQMEHRYDGPSFFIATMHLRRPEPNNWSAVLVEKERRICELERANETLRAEVLRLTLSGGSK